MYSVIREEEEIKKYQYIFRKIFRADAIKYENKKFGYHGGSDILDVFWSPVLEFWSASKEKSKNGNRYLNWFGFNDPKNNNNSLSVDVEISISIQGSRTAGKFVSDGKDIYIAHNGDIRTNLKRIKDIFWEHYIGDNGIVENEKVAIIAKLPLVENASEYSDFKNKICDFIKNAYGMKKNSVSNEIKQQPIQDEKKEIINKVFDIILPILPKFIQKILTEHDKTEWWEKYIIRKLPDKITRDLPKSINNDEGINKLDIYDCLLVIIENWHDIFKHKMPNVRQSWVHDIKEIRNDVSHWTIEKQQKYSYDDINHALYTMELFMRPIDIGISEQISIIKRGFENKYKSKLKLSKTS